MGSLWTKYINPKTEFRILMQGLDAAGKTTVLYKLKLGEVVTTIPTIGFNVETLEYKNISFTTWDVGGRDKIRPLYRHYYPNTNALIFVIDSNDRERIDQVKEEFHRTIENDELKDTAILVYANKQDLDGAMSVVEIAEKINLYKVKQKCNIISTVATTGEGLYEGLEWLSCALTEKTAVDKFIAANTYPKKYMFKGWESLKRLFVS